MSDARTRRSDDERQPALTARRRKAEESQNQTDAGDDMSRRTDEIRDLVRARYGDIATERVRGCCGPGCVDAEDVDLLDPEYEDLPGYFSEADLGLGCGLPTEYANVRPGDTVLDLGSGGGIDAFIVRQLVGEEGEVLGVDMTPEMVQLARNNADRLGYDNVRFLHADIESIPIPEASVDVILSNCVLNLVPDKPAAFAEMYRVLRQGGHFSISDIVIQGDLPESVRQSAELYAGCVGGAISLDEYLELLAAAGFADVKVVSKKEISVPDELLARIARPQDVEKFRADGGRILSLTVFGFKA